MKKIIIPILVAATLLASSCPNVVVTGNPSFKFSASKNLNDEFEESLKGAIDGFQLTTCTNTQTQTFILRMELFKKIIKEEEILAESPGLLEKQGDDLYTMDRISVGEGNEKLPEINFGSLLKAFNINTDAVKTLLFVSGPDIVNVLAINLQLRSSGDVDTIEDFSIPKTVNRENKPSGYDEWKNRYTGTNAPEGVFNAPSVAKLLNSKDENNIYCVVSLEKDQVIKPEWLNSEEEVLVELIIWFPMDFIAGEYGGTLDFPDFFGNEDLFGRSAEPDEYNTEVSLVDMIESLNISIILNTNEVGNDEHGNPIPVSNPNPFRGAMFLATNTGDNEEISNTRIEGNSLMFIINQNNSTYPFSPKFSIQFDEGQSLKFPSDFGTTFISIDARLNIEMDL
jgi:hypothetical protein